MTYGERKKTLYLLNDNVNSFVDVINILRKYMNYLLKTDLMWK